jgi:hypothetical protein
LYLNKNLKKKKREKPKKEKYPSALFKGERKTDKMRVRQV